jgi:hypothetical protein
MSGFVRKLAILCCALVAGGVALAEEAQYRPYVLAAVRDQAPEAALEQTRRALADAGFEIVGEYAPYPGAHVLAVTRADLRQAAGKSSSGGYAAAQRVSLTASGGKVQLAYTNPLYMMHMYRLEADLQPVADALAKALGRDREFGSKYGQTVFGLRQYHYMPFMPYFTDQLALARYANHAEAIAAVEAGLAAGRGGTRKVYRVDVAGKSETLFGVAIKGGEGADQAVMTTTDSAELKHTPHLPYELLVSGGEVRALHGKFRIAQSFPDLGMGTFMKISGAPDAIEAALRVAAGGSR